MGIFDGFECFTKFVDLGIEFGRVSNDLLELPYSFKLLLTLGTLDRITSLIDLYLLI